MVLQGDDDGHEGRDGRRRGLPSEASGGRYATHCWALTRPLGRLGRHRLVSGGAIAQQWLVDREHDYASIYASIYAISCFDAPSCHDRYCCCCCCYGLRYCYRYCRAGPLRQVRTGCDGGLYGDDGRRLRGTGGLRRVDGAARAGDFGHYVECTGRTTRVQAVWFAAATSSGHSRGAGPTETREGWGREAPFLVQNRRAGTWLAGLRRGDAVSKCQNCPPIIFGTCNYADFRGNFHHGAISSRGNVSGHCCSSADRVIITLLMTTQ